VSLRVVYVTMGFPTPYETFAANDVRALCRAGVDVTVFSLRPPHAEASSLVRQWRLDGVGISHNSLASSAAGLLYAFRHPVRTLRFVMWLVSSMWRKPRFALRMLMLVPRCLDILAEIERVQPDVVHLFWGHYPAAVGFLIRRYCSTPVLSVFLGAYDLEWNFGVSAPVARSADVVWTHTRANVPAIQALGVPHGRIRVAHRGIDLGRFLGPPPEKVAKRIVTAGRLHPEKGMGHVIEAFPEILRRHPTASLTIAGDGPDRLRLEALAATLGIANAVSFLGRVSHERVLEELGRAELFVYLSTDITDRLPNVVKEAVASRCLCIVSQTTGIEELIRDGIDGWVVERGDIPGAVARTCEALDDRDRSASMIAAANAHLREEFDIDDSMRRYADRWRELVGLKRGDEPPHRREERPLAGKPEIERAVLR